MTNRRRLAAALVVGAALGGAARRAGDPAQLERLHRVTRYSGYVDAPGTFGAVYTIQPNGTGERRVTRPPPGTVDFQPDWSGDGARIVFEREFADESKPHEIWTVTADGTDAKLADPGCPPGFTENCDDSSPAWSPDAQQIAFGRAYGTERILRGDAWIEVGALAVMDADGGKSAS